MSFPVAWSDLADVTPADFTVRTAPALLGDADPWTTLMPAPQPLPAELVEQGRTIPAARAQALHEELRRQSPRRTAGTRVNAPAVRVLPISGSTRAGSSNTLVLQAMHEIDHPGVTSALYQGLALLPAFVPDLVPTPVEVDDLLARITSADAVVFSTPEYAGGLPGALKNLLDWTVGGGQLYEKPVAWLDVANVGRGQGALEQLRTVLGYVAARVIEPACIRIGIDHTQGTPTLRDGARQQLHNALGQLIAAITSG